MASCAFPKKVVDATRIILHPCHCRVFHGTRPNIAFSCIKMVAFAYLDLSFALRVLNARPSSEQPSSMPTEELGTENISRTHNITEASRVHSASPLIRDLQCEAGSTPLRQSSVSVVAGMLSHAFKAALIRFLAFKAASSGEEPGSLSPAPVYPSYA